MRSASASIAAPSALLKNNQGPGSAALYVTDADGRIVGLLTRQALGEVMMIRAARPDWRFDRKA